MPSWLLELASHRNRSKHLANCLRTLHKGHTPEQKLRRLLRDIGTATTNMLKFVQALASDPGVLTESMSEYKLPLPRVEELADLLGNALTAPLRTAVALDLFADRLGELHAAHASDFQAGLKQSAQSCLCSAEPLCCQRVPPTQGSDLSSFNSPEGPIH